MIKSIVSKRIKLTLIHSNIEKRREREKTMDEKNIESTGESYAVSGTI